ncbi:MAG: hypothetical protein Q9163_005969, partial [Psora crenata]
MHLPHLAYSIAVSFLCGNALGLRVPIKDVREYQRDLLHKREAASELEEVFHEHQKRIVCLEDDVLLSFQAYLDDATQFCSQYIGIQDTTATTTAVVKTTVTIIGTTVATITGGTTTIPESTITVTNTPGVLNRRDMLLKRQDPNVTPPASIFSSISETPLNASLISMVSSGCSCLFITPGVDVSTTSILSTRTITGLDHRAETALATVTNGVTTVTVTPNPTAFGTGSASIGYSGNATIQTGTGLTDTRGGGGLGPTGFFASTSSSVGPRTTTYPVTQTSLIISTPTTTFTFANGTNSAGTAVSSGTGIISPSNTTFTTSPTGTGFPPLQGCPLINGSRYVTRCSAFELECYTNFDGPVDQGLIEPDLYECIDGCARANQGFSQVRCYAASYIPAAVGPNCFFKTFAASREPLTDGLAVSALLISSDACSNNSTSVSATSSYVSASTGSSLPSNNSTIRGSSASSYSKVSASMMASAS